METIRKRSKVHKLPTKDKTDIIENNSLNFIYHSSHKDYSHWSIGENDHLNYQHLYFTTDEEIKEGDWYMTDDLKLLQCNKVIMKLIYSGKDYGRNPNGVKKIIASTNPKLTDCNICSVDLTVTRGKHKMSCKDAYKRTNLPQPSQTFIEEYCKQEDIDEVDVEYEEWTTMYRGDANLRLKLNLDNTIITHLVEEKMYSREDMIHALTFGHGKGMNRTPHAAALKEYYKHLD